MDGLIDLPVPDEGASQPLPTAAMEGFCRAVATAIEGVPVTQMPARVAEIFPELLATPGLLTDAQMASPADGYGRNRVFICPQDRFSVLAMIWPPGVSTPIHDHRDWCALGVYEGEIEETRYDPADPADPMSGGDVAVPRETVRYRMGSIGHLPVNAPNIHMIHNPTGEVAISIHVYGGNCDTLGPNLDKVYTVDP